MQNVTFIDVTEDNSVEQDLVNRITLAETQIDALDREGNEEGVEEMINYVEGLYNQLEHIVPDLNIVITTFRN